MIIYREQRKRVGYPLGDLYKIRSWYLFGLILIFRRYEQLTVRGTMALPSESE